MSTNKECQACAENGHDSTGDHLWEMRDGTWGCLKGDYHKDGKPYFEGKSSVEQTSVKSFEELLNTIDTGESEAHCETVEDSLRGINRKE